MAKKKKKKTVIKKKPVSAIIDVLELLESSQALLQKRIEQLERPVPVEDYGSQIKALGQRIDRLVEAIYKSKRIKGI